MILIKVIIKQSFVKNFSCFDRIHIVDPTHPFCPHCDTIPTGSNANCCTGWCYPNVLSNRPIRPSANKIVRLAFHDCLKYTDGSGGCDGCLDWNGMGIVYRTKDAPINGQIFKQYPDTASEFVGNNNLHQTVLALEHVYDNKELLPSKMSLRELGKSRADLWALAGITAIEFSVNNNNLGCKSKTVMNAQLLRAKQVTCGSSLLDENGCTISMPDIPFKTGRADCVPDSVNMNR